MMPDNIKIPGIGDVPKKYAIGGVVVVGGFIVIMYIRNKGAGSAATASTSDTASTTDPIDPATGIPYSQESGYGSYGDGGIDPSTGIPYTEETGYGGVSTGLDAAGYPIGSSADLAWNQTQQSGITTNSDWIQAAMNGALPGDPGTIQTALLGVLSGMAVTEAQRSLFLEAVAVLGNPPGGYPQPIKTTDTAAQPGSTTGAAKPKVSSQVKVPNTVGQTQAGAFAIVTQAGLHPKGTPDVPGKILTVVSQSPKAGATVARNSTVTLSSKVK